MGDMADLALDRAFDDYELYQDCKRLSKSEQYDLGIIDESGEVIGKPWSLPVVRKVVKPVGPGPCPICGSNTVIRKNRFTGVKFYGCSRFPCCRGNRDFS